MYHKKPVHAIQMEQNFMCCQVDAALLIVVRIPQHGTIDFLYVGPLLTYTQLPYLILIIHVLITVSST